MFTELATVDADDRCNLSRIRHKDFRGWRQRWSLLIYVLGAAAIIFAIAVLFFALRGQSSQATLAAGGAVVDGAVVAFVLSQKTAAMKDEKAAWREVLNYCGSDAQPM